MLKSANPSKLHTVVLTLKMKGVMDKQKCWGQRHQFKISVLNIHLGYEVHHVEKGSNFFWLCSKTPAVTRNSARAILLKGEASKKGQFFINTCTKMQKSCHGWQPNTIKQLQLKKIKDHIQTEVHAVRVQLFKPYTDTRTWNTPSEVPARMLWTPGNMVSPNDT